MYADEDFFIILFLLELFFALLEFLPPDSILRDYYMLIKATCIFNLRISSSAAFLSSFPSRQISQHFIANKNLETWAPSPPLWGQSGKELAVRCVNWCSS